MIERLNGHVNSIRFIEKYQNQVDLCEMEIDFDTLKIFYAADDLMQFLNQDVQYTTRPDVVHGQPALVICEIALLSTIQTISSTENIKLIPEGSKRTICNLESKTIRFGDFYPGVTALLSKFELGSSPKAKWYDCTMIDSVSQEFVVRMFTSKIDEANELLSTMVGKYVQFDLESTKYGYQTKEIDCLPNEVEDSPEVVVAREVITNVINSDPALVEYAKSYDFINEIGSKIDGEPGYQLVRMASEIYMINAVDNISTNLDIRAMKRAVICSRGYLISHKTDWSRPMLNTNKIMRIPELKKDRELMLILDVMSGEEFTPTKKTYIKIRGLVNDIVNIRRNVLDEKDNSNFAGIISVFNGLL